MSADAANELGQQAVIFTEFDVIVCVLMLVTAVMAFSRGFIRDSLRLVGYLAASFSTLALYPFTASIFSELFRSSLVTSAVAVIILFLLSLMVFSLFVNMMLDNMRELRMGPIDRTAGALFGLLKGWLIVSIIHYGVFITYFFFDKEEPRWLVAGETYELTKKGSNMIDNWVGEEVRQKHDEYKEQAVDEAVQRRLDAIEREINAEAQ